MKSRRRTGITVFLLLAITSAAWAHAFLDHAEPAVGGKVHGWPSQVKIWFTEKLEPALSKIQVLDASNEEVDQGDVQTDKSNPALLTVSLRMLKPGNYKVVWRAVSVDTHVTTGNYTFEVVP
jgi:methionine-rich copper-binding protein CopC